jgi:hypothetical protein
MELLRMNGRHPKNEKRIQTSVTIMNPSRLPRLDLAFLVKSRINPPVIRQIDMDIIKVETSGPL